MIQGGTIKHHITISTKAWWVVLALLGYLMFNSDKVVDIVPASVWLEVHSIHVEDGGSSPNDIILKVARTIHLPFGADWLVELERKRGERYVVICSRRGNNDYSTDGALPDPLTLAWWMDDDTCHIPKGTYRLTTRWDLAIKSGKVVRVISNDFNTRWALLPRS